MGVTTYKPYVIGPTSISKTWKAVASTFRRLAGGSSQRIVGEPVPADTAASAKDFAFRGEGFTVKIAS